MSELRRSRGDTASATSSPVLSSSATRRRSRTPENLTSEAAKLTASISADDSRRRERLRHKRQRNVAGVAAGVLSPTLSNAGNNSFTTNATGGQNDVAGDRTSSSSDADENSTAGV